VILTTSHKESDLLQGYSLGCNTYICKPVGYDQFVMELHRLIDPPFDLEGFIIYASITIGIIDSSVNLHEPEEFLRAAEIPNYNAKEQGLQYPTVVYERSIQIKALEGFHMEIELRPAISEQQLQLLY
jgi:predicted signal transduction protein with EAL and GGDEF domain